MADYYGRGRYGYGFRSFWAPYVSVAERRRQAVQKVAALNKKGREVSPVQIDGRTIASTFWGKAWCDNLEAYSDFENRLPRGRTYVRNGSVIDLQIAPGKITALVSGSSVYTVEIGIQPVEKPRWRSIIGICSGKIDSLVELLQGRLSRGVMEVITCKEKGLFPAPRQMSFECSCPDYASMCKHVAAVLYGVGHRLDQQPELLFALRKIDHTELIARAAAGTGLERAAAAAEGKVLDSSRVAGLFGIDLEPEESRPGDRMGKRSEKAPKKGRSKARAKSRGRPGRRKSGK